MSISTLAQEQKNYYDEIYDLEASGYRYSVENSLGCLGAYQMSVSALIEAGFIDKNTSNAVKAQNQWDKVRWLPNSYGIASKSQFLRSKEAQDFAVRRYTDDQWRQAEAFGLDKYIGQTIQGIEITKEGILGMEHLGGVGGARDFLHSGKDYADDYKTSISDYARKMGSTILDPSTFGQSVSGLWRGTMICGGTPIGTDAALINLGNGRVSGVLSIYPIEGSPRVSTSCEPVVGSLNPVTGQMSVRVKPQESIDYANGRLYTISLIGKVDGSRWSGAVDYHPAARCTTFALTQSNDTPRVKPNCSAISP